MVCTRSSRLMVVVWDTQECPRIIKVIKSIAIVVRGPLKILNNETRIYSIEFYSSRGRGTLKTEEP